MTGCASIFLLSCYTFIKRDSDIPQQYQHRKIANLLFEMSPFLFLQIYYQQIHRILHIFRKF